MSIPADNRATVLAGIGLISGSYFLFTVHDALIKLLVTSFAVWQVLFFRSLTILIGCAILGGGRLYAESARSPILGKMFLRSLIIMGAWLCYFTAAKDLQLAELTTIYFAAPIIVVVLAILLLGEKVNGAQWTAVLTGFAGVFIACDPASLGLSLPVLLVLIAAFGWGLSIVLLRKIARDEKTSVQMVLNNCFFLATAGIPLIFYWRTPDLAESAILIGAGVVGGIAQITMFEAMKRATASVLAPLEYPALVWAFLLGYLIWGDVPRPGVFYGATLIVAAGFIVIVAEHIRRPARVRPAD